ncbi:DinB family protein [Paenibacillus sp. HB172176]|uniref:DinB family protein n=1 Tax=Paenibacillus sp. HB172176 TaxID=2493690 RepID=UPI001F108157|nr:DinB family protein [Paenibacillus sp. HB172176]
MMNMYTSIEEVTADLGIEAALTQKVLDRLTDASLKQAVSEQQARTLGDIARHVVMSLKGIFGAGGLQIDVPGLSLTAESSSAEIAEGYRQVSEAAIAAMKEQWTDAKLSEDVMLFGAMKMTRSSVVNLILRHQIHHRGQITILMRQAGLPVPGVYGPSEEENAARQAAQK